MIRGVDEAIQNFISLSLIVIDSITDNYRVHRLVQNERRDWLGPSRRETTFLNASRLLFEAFPRQIHMQTLHPYWPACNKCIQHAASLSYNVRKFKLHELPWDSPSTFQDTLIYATLCPTVGVIQREQGKTSLAYPWFQKAIDIRQTLFPPDNPDLANIHHNMAGALLTDYRTDEAIKMCTDATARGCISHRFFGKFFFMRRQPSSRVLS
ncbi:Uncharacterized protein HZ326_3499 [Fusarium oxysporum f. sp. albedinis]|nr:Uncharacterized protein HZ326_3499 [Fusarium oxysporum f. sp. albedinis]